MKYILTSTIRDSFGRFLTNDNTIQNDNTPLSDQMLFNSKEEALKYRDDNGYFAMEVSEELKDKLIYAAQKKLGKEIERNLKRHKSAEQSNEAKNQTKKNYYYAKLLNKNNGVHSH